MIARLVFNKWTLGAVGAAWAWAQGGSTLKNTFNTPASGTGDAPNPQTPPTALESAAHTADVLLTDVGNTVHNIGEKAATLATEYASDKDGTLTQGTPNPTAGSSTPTAKEPSLLQKAMKAVGLGGNEDGQSSEEGMPWYLKLLLGGGGVWGGWKLLQKFTGGGDDKDSKNSNSGFGWGTLLMVGALIAGAVVAFKNWDGLKEGFHKVTGNTFNSATTPSVSQRLNLDPTGRATLVTPAPVTVPTTPTAKAFADKAIIPVTGASEIQARTEIQVENAPALELNR